jgi:hypothetical protein
VQKILRFHAIQSLALITVVAWASSALAVNIRIDYSMDASGFFGDHNPQGTTGAAQATAAMEAAADFYSGILGDTFSAITPPTKQYYSLGGEANWFWKWRFADPETGNTSAMINPQVTADDYVVFVGARDLLGDEAGRGGPGGFVGGFVVRNGQFTSAEKDQITQMTDEFADATTIRGQSTGFSRWGGSIAFDNLKDWHFDRATDPLVGEEDFYSVALHELGHALGLGTSDEWNKLVVERVVEMETERNFTGANVKAILGNTTGGILASSDEDNFPDDDAHWLQTIAMSTVYDGVVTQTPLMVPVLNMGETRRQLTNLDAAALKDIGWEIDLPGGAAASALVDGGDAGGTINSNSFSGSSISSSAISSSTISGSLVAYGVPEPSSLLLFVLGGVVTLLTKPRRFR